MTTVRMDGMEMATVSEWHTERDCCVRKVNVSWKFFSKFRHFDSVVIRQKWINFDDCDE